MADRVGSEFPGRAITEYCDDRLLDTRERAALFAEACRTVHQKHQRGQAHGHLQPSEILVAGMDAELVIRVAGFGEADEGPDRKSQYLSPERRTSGPAEPDPVSDAYSLGIILYELLSGALPHDEGPPHSGGVAELLRKGSIPEPSARLCSLPTQRQVAASRRTTVARLRRELKAELDDLVLKAVRKDRSGRYSSALELAEELEAFVRRPGLARLLRRFRLARRRI